MSFDGLRQSLVSVVLRSCGNFSIGWQALSHRRACESPHHALRKASGRATRISIPIGVQHDTSEAPLQTDESHHSAPIILPKRDWQNDGDRMMFASCADPKSCPKKGSPPFVLERIHQPQGASPGSAKTNRD